MSNYETFSNACEAGNAGADIVFEDDCGDLEGESTSSIQMVSFATTRFDLGAQVSINEVSIRDSLRFLAFDFLVI